MGEGFEKKPGPSRRRVLGFFAALGASAVLPQRLHAWTEETVQLPDVLDQLRSAAPLTESQADKDKLLNYLTEQYRVFYGNFVGDNYRDFGVASPSGEIEGFNLLASRLKVVDCTAHPMMLHFLIYYPAKDDDEQVSKEVTRFDMELEQDDEHEALSPENQFKERLAEIIPPLRLGA